MNKITIYEESGKFPKLLSQHDLPKNRFDKRYNPNYEEELLDFKRELLNMPLSRILLTIFGNDK